MMIRTNYLILLAVISGSLMGFIISKEPMQASEASVPNGHKIASSALKHTQITASLIGYSQLYNSPKTADYTRK